MQEKTCRKCGETKPLSMFSNKGNGPNNFRAVDVTDWKIKKNTCKACDASYAKEYRAKNKGYRGSDKIKKYPKEERLLVSAIRTRLNVCKQTFRKRNNGICESDLTEDYLYDLYKKQKGKCIYTGELLGIIKRHPSALSLDKIIPKKGYTKGNVQWVCWAVNRAKGDLSEETFLNMCKVITERCND